MSDNKPTLSVRYFLNIDESQDGFGLATFGKKQFTRFLTPLVSLAILIWGFYLGLDGVGRYYVALGAFFIILQVIMRYWFLPMMFKRQFEKYQFGKHEQGIDLFSYTDVNKFAAGKLTYMIELKNSTVVIIPKRAFENETDRTLFENTFKK